MQVRSEIKGDSEAIGLRRCSASRVLLTLAAVPKVRRVCLGLALRLEGGQFYTLTGREILARHYGVTVGAFSYGSCFEPGAFPPRVTIGRYVSLAKSIIIHVRNHPTDRLSTHPFFFNARLGYVTQDNVGYGSLEIGHDAWIGERVIITPSCHRVGIGAIVGCGSVVTKDVPDFAIMGGCPARLIKSRFPEDLCRRVLESRWWDRPLAEVTRVLPAMAEALAVRGSNHPLLQSCA